MDTKRICPSCQKPLAQDVPMGLCPECLIKSGFPTGVETETESATPSAFVPPAIDELARLFPQLEVLELIGKGGMGAVYKARQKQLNRFVALKILRPGIGSEPAFAGRFTREAQALAQLNHPGIVTLHEFGQAGRLHYFLMEFVDGVNLRQLLTSSRVSAREALAIVPQICDALQFAHDHGIVHRDIKPENILLDRRGRVKVADFGLAKIIGNETELDPSGNVVVSTSLTDAGKVMGTPNYMSPEQVQAPSEVDHRADIYSLGVVFYQMLTGELPGKQLEAPSRKVRIDVRLDEIVLRALEKKPELRYQQAGAMKTQVETIASTLDAIGRGGNKSQSENSQPRQSWTTWSPLQSPEVGNICSHFTKAEQKHYSALWLVISAWVVGTQYGLLVFVRNTHGPGVWIVAAIWGTLFLVSIPMIGRLIRHFLCSTTWAREQGYTIDTVKLYVVTRPTLLKTLVFVAVGSLLIFGDSKLSANLSGSRELSQSIKEDAAQTKRLQKRLADQAAKSALTFGPVMERVVNLESPRTNSAINFKSGKFVSLPTPFFSEGTTNHEEYTLESKFMVENGVDAIGKLQYLNGLECAIGTAATEISVSKWNEATAAWVSDHAVSISNTLESRTMSGIGDLPKTYLFKTREGGRGILQITSFTESPRGLKIRYKLVQLDTPRK